MQFIPLSEKGYPYEHGINESTSSKVTLPKLLTNPYKRTAKSNKSNKPEVESVTYLGAKPLPKPINSMWKPTATTNLQNLQFRSTQNSEPQLQNAKQGRKTNVLEQIASKKGATGSVLSELASLDMRLKRLKQKVKEKVVESSLGESLGLFEELFQSSLLRKQFPEKSHKTPPSKCIKSSESLVKAKKPSKIIHSPCLTCGQPYKSPKAVKKQLTAGSSAKKSATGSKAKSSKKTVKKVLKKK